MSVMEFLVGWSLVSVATALVVGPLLGRLERTRPAVRLVPQRLPARHR
jgi:hypothetical protein